MELVLLWDKYFLLEDYYVYFEYNISMRNKTDMERKNFYLSKNELKFLEKEAKKIGITISEVIRRIIDSYFENIK